MATSLLMIAILLVGLSGYKFLPLSALPEVDYPTIQVQTFLPGASPDVMTTSVTAPLEKQFGQMPGLKEMSSISSAGSSVITLQFDLSLNLDIAEQEVQAAINAGSNLLPSTAAGAAGLCQGQSGRRAGDHPGGHRPARCPSPRWRTWPIPASPRRFRSCRASAWSVISGGQRPAVRVQANLQKLAALGLNIDDLRTTISNNNSNSPKGSFDGAAQSYTINANDQLQYADSYNNIVVAYKNGAPVLSDGCRQCRAGRAEHQAVQLGQQDAGRADQCAAPARRQRHRRWWIPSRNCCPRSRRACRPRWTSRP